MNSVVTVLGKDKRGIIYKVSKVLYECDANIIDVSQTVMQSNIFSMIMLVDISDINCDFAELKDRLDRLGTAIGLSILIQQEDIFDAMHNI